MDGKILNSEGHYIAFVRANAIYGLSGKKLYDLKGQNIYKTTGELVGHLKSTGARAKPAPREPATLLSWNPAPIK
jgi:hypothetical protein